MLLKDYILRGLQSGTHEFTADLYNFAVYYSLSKVKATQVNCVDVERSSDNTTQTFGFVDNFVDTASILSFVGAGDGIVTKWYNQGNVSSADISNSSSTVKIVDAGNLIFEGSRAALRFDGTTGAQLSNSANISTQANTSFVVFNQFTNGVNASVFDGNGGNRQFMRRKTTNHMTCWAGTFLTQDASDTLATTRSLVSALFNGSSSFFQVEDGLERPTGGGNVGNNDLTTGIHVGGLGSFVNGTIQMVGIIDSDQWSNRDNIKTSIRTHL